MDYDTLSFIVAEYVYSDITEWVIHSEISEYDAPNKVSIEKRVNIYPSTHKRYV